MTRRLMMAPDIPSTAQKQTTPIEEAMKIPEDTVFVTDPADEKSNHDDQSSSDWSTKATAESDSDVETFTDKRNTSSKAVSQLSSSPQPLPAESDANPAGANKSDQSFKPSIEEFADTNPFAPNNEAADSMQGLAKGKSKMHSSHIAAIEKGNMTEMEMFEDLMRRCEQTTSGEQPPKPEVPSKPLSLNHRFLQEIFCAAANFVNRDEKKCYEAELKNYRDFIDTIESAVGRHEIAAKKGNQPACNSENLCMKDKELICSREEPVKKDTELADKETEPGRKNGMLSMEETHASKLVKKNAKLAAKNTELSKRNDRKDRELAQKNEELAQKNEELAQKNEELAQKNEELAQKNHELAQRSKDLTEKNKELSKKDAEITKWENKGSELANELENKNRQMTAKHLELHEKSNLIIQKNAEVIDKNNLLFHKDMIINAKDSELRMKSKDRNGMLIGFDVLHRAIADKDKEIQLVRAHSADQNDDVACKKGGTANMNHGLSEELRDMKTRLAQNFEYVEEAVNDIQKKLQEMMTELSNQILKTTNLQQGLNESRTELEATQEALAKAKEELATAVITLHSAGEALVDEKEEVANLEKQLQEAQLRQSHPVAKSLAGLSDGAMLERMKVIREAQSVLMERQKELEHESRSQVRRSRAKSELVQLDHALFSCAQQLKAFTVD